MSKNYLDLTGLTAYDKLIKQYVDNNDSAIDAKSIKTVLVDGDNIKFYKKAGATKTDTADYTVPIASSDVTALKTAIGTDASGNLISVATTAKNAATAIQGSTKSTVADIETALSNATTASKVTLSVASTTAGYLKTYEIKQGNTTLGKIDIPNDLVVTSGEVVVNPQGQTAGTYLKLVIANQTEPVYINVKDLVDVYSGSTGTNVNIAISDKNVVSGAIVAGSIGSTQLDTATKASLKLADSALQQSAITALTSTVSQASTGTAGLELNVEQENGKLKSVSGSINTISQSEIDALFTTK